MGCAWTAVPGARNQEYLQRTAPLDKAAFGAKPAAVYKLTRDVLSIGREMLRDNPATLPIAALGWMVPFIILGNYAIEYCFARWWMTRYMQSRTPRKSAVRIAELVC